MHQNIKKHTQTHTHTHKYPYVPRAKQNVKNSSEGKGREYTLQGSGRSSSNSSSPGHLLNTYSSHWEALSIHYLIWSFSDKFHQYPNFTDEEIETFRSLIHTAGKYPERLQTLIREPVVLPAAMLQKMNLRDAARHGPLVPCPSKTGKGRVAQGHQGWS